MKIKAIGKLCADKLQIVVTPTADPRENWIGDGYAAYFVPQMKLDTVDDLLTIWDVPRDKQSKYLLRIEKELDDIISLADDDERDCTAASGMISVIHRGRVLMPFYAGGEMLLIDRNYFAPIKDDDPDILARPDKKGQMWLIAKKGMLIEAVISTVRPDAELYARLQNMVNSMGAGMREE